MVETRNPPAPARDAPARRRPWDDRWRFVGMVVALLAVVFVACAIGDLLFRWAH